ncbi:MAG: rod shape-determining protein RodA [Nitrospiraceae bacterium]|nr:rod shape-determining protein RodA [Nitrospiraceae bacterium]
MQIDRRLIKNFDWVSFSIVLMLSIISIMTIFSTTRAVIPGEETSFYIRQIIWLIIGIAILFLIVSFDYIWLSRYAYPLYIIGILLLISVLIAGKVGMGAKRWLYLGFFSFQPSEFFRIIFVIFIARYFIGISENMGLYSLFSIFIIFVFIPLIMILKQPDLGTALMILIIFLSLSLIKGLQKKVVTFLLIVSIVSIPFIGNIVWDGLKDYQKNRLVAFIDPDIDPAGIGYHINQSKVAIGSGGFAGKGYMQGTQGPFRFLPEKHTDFIFAAFAEEWGFIGCFLLLLLYLAFILRGIDTAIKAKDEFGRLLAVGITFMFTVYIIINIGMTLGLMPVVGIPLPFMSYGGTALLSNFIAAGLLINVRTRRFELFY